MKILAIDASTKSTGYAIYEDEKLVKYGCFTASSLDVIKRIQKIVGLLEHLIADENIERVILEEVISEKGKTNKTYKALMWLQAAINFMVHDIYQIPIDYLLPNEWRAAIGIHTGRGVCREELKRKDIDFVKKNFDIEANDDICDAICLGYAYIMMGGDDPYKEGW